jgi:hypothetical protein
MAMTTFGRSTLSAPIATPRPAQTVFRGAATAGEQTSETFSYDAFGDVTNYANYIGTTTPADLPVFRSIIESFRTDSFYTKGCSPSRSPRTAPATVSWMGSAIETP